MDLVLGLSLTSAAVRWVLVEGATGEGAPIDRGSLDIPAIDVMDADLLLDAVLNPEFVDPNRLQAIGVTCTRDAASAARVVLAALAARGLDNAVAVSDGDAAIALASGVAEITDYDDVAVCIVEPGSALIALVARGTVTVDRVNRPLDGADAFELTSGVIAALDVNEGRPDAVFVIGSDDVDVIVSSFEAILDVPVFSAAEADLALARGAALAAAGTVDVAESPAPGLVDRVTSRTAVLSGVLGVAVVTFVVSLTVALSGGGTPDSSTEQPENANAATDTQPAVVVPPKSVAPKAVPAPPTPTLQTVVAAAPPAPAPVAAPVYQPPAYVPPAPAYVPPAPAYVAPAPAYVPPAPAYVPPAPAYVPPAPVYTQPPAYREPPRLRDRIIERIPIINRFHEPGQ